MHQLERHLWEPLPSRGILHATNWIKRSACPTVALTVGFTRNFDPQECVDERISSIDCWLIAQTAVWRITPILWVAGGMIGRRDPGTLSIAARVDDEMLEDRLRVPPSLALDLIRIFLVRQHPGRKIVWVCRRILASAPFGMALAPGGRVRGESNTL